MIWILNRQRTILQGLRKKIQKAKHHCTWQKPQGISATHSRAYIKKIYLFLSSYFMSIYNPLDYDRPALSSLHARSSLLAWSPPFYYRLCAFCTARNFFLICTTVSQAVFWDNSNHLVVDIATSTRDPDPRLLPGGAYDHWPLHLQPTPQLRQTPFLPSACSIW